ncbi:hypothetical protein ON064_06285, partial [Planococcus sp. A6]|uniref:hypothetical protein n=1 Tax=Planococcus sp. A6 TaxID=2992760 RepID=UPI00237BE916
FVFSSVPDRRSILQSIVFINISCRHQQLRGIISNGVKYTRIPICSAGAFIGNGSEAKSAEANKNLLGGNTSWQ